MKIMIFERLDGLTNCYHQEGGLVIIAKNIDSAKKLVEQKKFKECIDEDFELSQEDLAKAKVLELSGSHKEEIIIFPDTGCC